MSVYWSAISLLLIVTNCCFFLHADSNTSYANNTPTSELCKAVVDEYGNVHTTRSLYTCAAVMQDPYMAVTSVAQYSDQNLTVSSQMVVNNLIEMNELENYVVIDLYFRLYWQDIRWEMSDLWQYVPISSKYDGIEIAPLVNRDDEPLPLWVPDVQFQDLIEENEVAVLLKLRPNGQFFYSRHLKVTIMQPTLDLTQYPKDEQSAKLRYESYGLTGGVMNLVFADNPVLYVSDEDGNINFEQNPVWYHKKGNYNSKSFIADYTTDSAFQRYFIALQIDIVLERAGKGVVIRFAVPILILLLLAWATYWAQLDSRVDTTMTVLLSVSALYVVIIGSIPQLGYLTVFDSWIFAMFVLLSVCVMGHLASIVLIRKSEDQPLRLFFSRVIEMTGRVVVLPVIVSMYLYTFFTHSNIRDWNYVIYAFLLLITLASLLLLFREMGGTRKSLRVALDHIARKLDEGQEPSQREMFVFNFCRFHAMSPSTAIYFSKQKRLMRQKAEEFRKSKHRDLEMKPFQSSSLGADVVCSPLASTLEEELPEVGVSRSSMSRNISISRRSMNQHDAFDSDDEV